MFRYLSAGCVSLALFYGSPARADIQPPELVASSISLSGGYVVGYIYCGGTYGQTYKGGRTAKLEVQVPGGPWVTLWSGTLPDIGPGGHYITRPYASPVKHTTTFRLTINGSDRNNANNVCVRTFRPLTIADPRVRASVVQPSDFTKKATSKARLVPK